MARAKKPSTPADMIRSLAVILVPIILITIFFTHNLRTTPVNVVDWKPVLTLARSEADFPIWAPTELPQDWRVNKASWVRKGNPDQVGTPVIADQWELGMLNAQDVYLEIDELDATSADFVADHTRQGGKDGTSTISGKSWTRLVSSDQRTRSLMLIDNGVTVVVSGDVGYSDLESFAGMLAAA